VSVTPFTVESTGIDGLAVLRAKQIDDDRGVVREWYRESAFVDAGLSSLGTILQVNLTETRQGAVRGMHAEDMTKLVGVASGEAFGAYVDLREGSSTHGAVATVALVPGVQVLVPAGVANGFQAVAEGLTQYLYCFDSEWQPGMAGRAMSPLDPDLGIAWPIPIDPSDRAQISEKDAALTARDAG
jgi:dTDP-4-dehydrorhamnose 3,5-epimerase